jgi:hypothetical protein
MAGHEENRCISNGEQFVLDTSSALAQPVSRQWKGYWRRWGGPIAGKPVGRRRAA